MMSVEGFKRRTEILVGRGYPKSEAKRIAELVGDSIEVKDGQWIVRDESGNIVGIIDPL